MLPNNARSYEYNRESITATNTSRTIKYKFIDVHSTSIIFGYRTQHQSGETLVEQQIYLSKGIRISRTHLSRKKASIAYDLNCDSMRLNRKTTSSTPTQDLVSTVATPIRRRRTIQASAITPLSLPKKFTTKSQSSAFRGMLPSPASITGIGVSSITIGGISNVSSISQTNATSTTYEDIVGRGCPDYSDFNVSFTPSMSEVLLAPTSSSDLPATGSSTGSGGPSVSNSPVATSSQGNSTDDGINSFYFYETEQFAVLWVLFTVIVLGNSAVLVTLFMNKNRKSRMNFFIKQLAIADLFVGLLNVLTDIIWRITVSWRAGNLACKLIRFLQVCVTYASTYVLVALSIDRYDAITHPMNFSGSWQRARRLVASAWAVSAIFSAPMLFLYEEQLIQGQTQCWIELGKPWRWQLYMSLVSATLFAFPALIISACYAIIVRTIWVKGAVFIPTERGRTSHASRRASSRGIIPRAKVKTVKMTFVIVIVFVVCWSPYIIFDLLQVFGQIPRTQTNIAIATFIQSLAPLNSAANPLIYCLFSTQVCRALKRIPPFRWILESCCCNTQGRSSTPIRATVGQRLHNSCDSMRTTLTTSLTVSRRSNCMRPARVVIVERPKTILAMSEV